MKTHSPQLILVFFTLLLVCSSAAGQNTIWRPITPAELEMKTPKVDPKVDAEALFWEVRLDDKKSNRLTYEHYVRVKIFTERGREKFSKMDIPFMKGISIEDIADQARRFRGRPQTRGHSRTRNSQGA
jgi:hypothetical protein